MQMLKRLMISGAVALWLVNGALIAEEQQARHHDEDELVGLHDPPPAARSRCILRTWATTAQRSSGDSG